MPRSSQTKGIRVLRKNLPFCSSQHGKKYIATSLFTWTDDEVELLLKVTIEYKVCKTAEGGDWESVQRKYSDILDGFREEKQMLCNLMAHVSNKLRARFTIFNRRMQNLRHNGNRTQINVVLPFT